MTADWKTTWRRAALAGSAGLGIAAVVLTCMITVNYVHLRRMDPLNLPELVQRRVEYSTRQSNEALKHEIRALDLMVRKAFFTTRRQLAAGAGVLAGCVAGSLLLLLVAGRLASPIPDVRGLPKVEGGWERRKDVWAGLWLAGGVLMAVAVAGWIGTPPLMELPDRSGSPATAGGANAAVVPGPTRAERLANWPGFRGPDGIGVAAVKAAPLKWDVPKGEGVKWKTALPLPGFSSPIVWGKKVFLTAGDATQRVVYAVDADSGALLWTTEVGAIPGVDGRVPEVSGDTGLAAPTPATDGRRVYALYATGELLCVDMDGKVAWKQYLGTPENHYGHASSLVVDGGLLYVQMDDASRPRVLALDTATGTTKWEQSRRAASWSSPVLVNTGARQELVLCDSQGVESYDPGTGASLWRVDCLGGEMAPSPAYWNGMLVVAGDNAKACGLKTGSGVPDVAWEWTDGLPDTASPLAFSNRVMMATSGMTLLLLSAETGKEVWKQELPRGCYASPILAGGHVYVLDRDGQMLVLEAGDTYKVVATCPLGEMAGATPAFTEGRIYIRGVSKLVCIGER